MNTSTDSADLQQIRDAAEQGNEDAQVQLGLGLLNAASAPGEIAEGVSWLRKAAEQNYVVAQLQLGALYCRLASLDFTRPAEGVVAEDHQEALKWFRRAADQGSSDAQLGLGRMYDHGTTATPKDLGEAIKWYTMAANNGESRAAAMHAARVLAAMYFDGKGVKRDYVEAAKWLRKLADPGWDGRSQARLGWMYENGKGVLQDIVEAHKWFNLAVEHLAMDDDKALEKELEDARSARSRVEQAMTAAQRTNAWQRYEQWKTARLEGLTRGR